MMIFKVFRPHEWEALRRTGRTRGAPVDLDDGFIHLSTADQLRGTLDKHFSGTPGLVLAACKAEAFGADLRWEPSRGGALFPHLYRDLGSDEIGWHAVLPIEDGRHVLPSGVA